MVDRRCDMKLQRLLKTRFAKVVEDAIDNGELNRWNIPAWVKEYNGWPDKTLEHEVAMLMNHFNRREI